MTLYIIAFLVIRSNRFRSLLVREFMAILNQLETRLKALMYCQRDRTPNTVEELKKQSTTVLHVDKELFSYRKQSDESFMKKIRALHQSPELELKHLHLVLHKD